MKATLRYYKPYIPYILLVAAFIFGQAMCELALPAYMADIINEGVVQQDLGSIWQIGRIMIAISLGSCLCSVVSSFFASRVAAATARDIRRGLFARVSAFSPAEMDSFSTASLITRSTNDVQMVQQATVMSLRMAFFPPIMGLGAIYRAVRTSPSLTWTIGLALLVIIGIMLLMFVAVMPKFKILQTKLDRLNQVISERLTGLLVVRAFNAEKTEEDRFEQTNRELTNINIFINRWMSFLMPALMLVMNLVNILIVWAGAKMIDSGNLLIGDMLAFLQYAMHVIFSFLFVTMMFIMIPRAAVSMNRIGEVLDTPISIKDPEQPLHFEDQAQPQPFEDQAQPQPFEDQAKPPHFEEGTASLSVESESMIETDKESGRKTGDGKDGGTDAPTDSETGTGTDSISKSGTIVFDHVGFAYPNAEEKTLSDISFTARPGQTTAIIGGTGSGKSSLISLIPRLFDVTEGSVTVSGRDVREVTQEELRDQIGYVPQKGLLFTGTVADNLRYGKEDATMEEMKEAATIAQALSFIEEMPEGFETAVAQGGTSVSGGQKQRLSIARALVKDPQILIFDDSFSALDFKTDGALRKALKERYKEKTFIIVAQRINTIMDAEQILVLDEGHLVGKGTHQELMATNDVYKEIAMSQLSEEELEKGGEYHG